MECDRGSFSTISAVLLSVGVSQETPKSVGDGCKSRNPWLEHISRKKQKSETGRCSLHPPVSLCPCIKGFPGEIRKKVRKLLYHSLRTNVEKVGHFDTILHVGCTGRKVGCTCLGWGSFLASGVQVM